MRAFAVARLAVLTLGLAACQPPTASTTPTVRASASGEIGTPASGSPASSSGSPAAFSAP